MTSHRSRRLSLAAALGATALALSACSGSGPDGTGAASADTPSTGAAETTPTPSSPAPSSPAASPSSPAAASASSEEARGAVAVYEDFACPHCASFHEQYGGFLLGLTEGGQAEVEYRIVDFLGGGDVESWSTRAATAYYCFDAASDDDGKTHAYQTQLFEAQQQRPDDARLVERAGQMDVDIAACVDGDAAAEQITGALEDFRGADLPGVPSITVDGTAYDGAADGAFIPWVQEAVGVRG